MKVEGSGSRAQLQDDLSYSMKWPESSIQELRIPYRMKSCIVAGARAIARLVLMAALSCALAGNTFAQRANGQANDESEPPIERSVATPGAPVEIDGRPVVLIYSP